MILPIKCTECGSEMVQAIQEVLYTYKDKTLIVPDVQGYYCTGCGESLHDIEESSRLNSEMLRLNREIDG